MILPYSTDAPIYHFPWMTITLIGVNCVTFGLTGMGYHSDGWLLQYGNGLHPLEWLAYNFLHFGPVHLLGNMFFLWAFGIVVEGKLGWWKFLAIYLATGVLGGFLIQVAMLGYQVPLDDFAQSSAPARITSWLEPSSAMAQDADFDADDDGLMEGEPMEGDPMVPGDDGDAADEELTPEQIAQLRREMTAHIKPGGGGASLIVFALLGVALVWAPKNEVSCFYILGFRAGTFELEYLYFCGLKIVLEVLGVIWGVRGFEVTSEVAHVLGVSLGFGAAALFLKMNWVDCENWDLFAYLQNKHGSMVEVGAWQNAAAIPHRRGEIATPETDDRDVDDKPRKRRAKPKLVELKSLDDDFPADEPVEDLVEIIEDPPKPASGRSAGRRADAPRETPLGKIRALVKQGLLNEALAEYRRQRAADRSFELPEATVSALADGFFRAQNVRDARAFLEEYIRRFPETADRHRVKLAVLYVKFLKSPTAAIKLLASVNRPALPEDYQALHQRVVRQAQQMIADGTVDAI